MSNHRKTTPYYVFVLILMLVVGLICYLSYSPPENGNDNGNGPEPPPHEGLLTAPNAPTYSLPNTALYAENIVYDSATKKYWWIFTDYRPRPYTIGLAWATDINGPWIVEAGYVIAEANYWVYAPHLVKFDGYWYIYYGRDNGANADVYAQRSRNVNRGYSADGISNPIIPHGGSGAWDGRRACECYVFLKGSTYYCFYMGEDTANLYEQTGYATSSSPSGGFRKYAGNPVLPADGYPHGWDSGKDRAADPFVFQDGTDWFVGVTACSSGKNYWKIGFYRTKDFVTFTHLSNNPILDWGPSGSWDDTKVLRGAVCEFHDIFYLPYTGYEDFSTARMGITTLKWVPET